MTDENKHPMKKPRPMKPRGGKSAPKKKKKEPIEVVVTFSGDGEDEKKDEKAKKGKKPHKNSPDQIVFRF
jgi:hypothetical protein